MPTILLNVTNVTSVPSRSMWALPSGNTKSLDWASSDNGKDVPYNSSFSRNTTGFGSRMAAFNKPLASSALYGATTFNPGHWENHDAKHCECCAATPAAAPLGPLNTIGTFMLPLLMYACFAALFTIWSMACIAKLNV